MWFCNCWTGFSQRIGSTERCWLSFEQPSIPPVQHFISVCNLRLLLIHLPALCERIDIQRFSRKDGLLSSCIRLSSAQSLPRSLLSTQKRPVVLRYRLVSRCAVAPRWSAVYLPAALQSRSVDYDGCSPIHEHQERPVWGEEVLSVYFTEIAFCLRCLPSWTVDWDRWGFSDGFEQVCCRVTIRQAWQEVCVATVMISSHESSWQLWLPILCFKPTGQLWQERISELNRRLHI